MKKYLKYVRRSVYNETRVEVGNCCTVITYGKRVEFSEIIENRYHKETKKKTN